MKTICSPKLLTSRLIGLLALFLSVCTVAEGQTYRLLKAGNDNSSATDRQEISKILSPTDLQTFNFLRMTSLMVGAVNGQEITLSKVPGTCLRAHSSIPDFNTMGIKWLSANPNLKAIILNIDNAEDLNQIGTAVGILTQTNNIQYLILQTSKGLYTTTDATMYETEGLNIVAAAISSKLDALFNKGIRVFHTAIDYK